MLAIVAVGMPKTAARRATRDGLLTSARLALGAFMAIGSVQHARFPQFVAQLIPAWMPARVVLAWLAGAALLAGAAGMQVRRTRRLAATLSAVMLGSWVLIVHLPRSMAAVSATERQNEWTALCEALCFAGTALLIAASAET